MPEETFTVTLTHEGGYRFLADFGPGEAPPLLVDERPPLGGNEGPNPSRLLATAVGHCLSASLLFCLAKARIEVRGLRTTVTGDLARNEKGRLRVGGFQVTLEPDLPAEAWARLSRCGELFEEFCVVTASVRRGLDVAVALEPFDTGAELESLAGEISS